MPEIVYPKPAENGSDRTWQQVFPITLNEDDYIEYGVINVILERIAIENRFGKSGFAKLKEELLIAELEHFTKQLSKVEGGIHRHKEEFPESDHLDYDCTCPVSEDRKQLIEKRKKLFEAYGRRSFYIQRVFAELGGAYRSIRG